MVFFFVISSAMSYYFLFHSSHIKAKKRPKSSQCPEFHAKTYMYAQRLQSARQREFNEICKVIDQWEATGICVQSIYYGPTALAQCFMRVNTVSTPSSQGCYWPRKQFLNPTRRIYGCNILVNLCFARLASQFRFPRTG